jgi:hypothetical protein
MPRLNDAELYERGAKTLVASWEEYARGASGASVERLPGVAAAVFPHGPERAVYNNAIFDRGLPRGRRAEAIHAMERAYAAGGVSRFAAWVHEADLPLRRGLEHRGYRVLESTQIMAMELDGSASQDRSSIWGRRSGTSTCAPPSCLPGSSAT